MEEVLRDLVNALLYENLLGIVDKGIVTTDLGEMSLPVQFNLAEGELYFRLDLDAERVLLFRVCRERFIQSYKLSRLPILLVTNHTNGLTQKSLHPIELMEHVADALSNEQRLSLLPNLSEFLRELTDTIEHTSFSQEAAYEFHTKGSPFTLSSLLQVERLSSLRDRPFHPISRAKRGLDADAYRNFSPEFGKKFGLDWIAVRRDCISQGRQAKEVANLILEDSELYQLKEAMLSSGLNSEDYLVLPVHPWHMEYILPQVFQEEFDQGMCVPLIKGLGGFYATSSLRTLAPVSGGQYHIKLPIGIHSLGTLRILPPHYFQNGEKGQALLQQVIDKDPILREGLHLCSEKLWWGYRNPEWNLFEDKLGYLSCLIREYPGHLIENEDIDLISMSALAVMDSKGKVPAFSQLLAYRYGIDNTESQVLNLFHEICHQFISMALTCFRYGIMPEIHGQNVLLILRHGQVSGVVLRDHDTMRLHLPWLVREGFKDPGYINRTPNSLMKETPEALLAYFQTLGIQVNLYAIIDVLSRAYLIDQTELWREVRNVIQFCLRYLDFPKLVRKVLRQQLLDNPIWPTRLLITPLLKKSSTDSRGMPTGIGETHNPLQMCFI
ncbi:TPA: hypothetical protein QCY71_005348 [Bacillus cereus]|nr:hypothetical protein [Bacillus cereus]